MATLAPNNAYPDKSPWVDLKEYLVNGWIGESSNGTRSIKAWVDGNTVVLAGSLVIGDGLTGTRMVALTLPVGLRPATAETFVAHIRGYGTCEIQILVNGTFYLLSWSGGALTDLPPAQILLFSHTYQRRVN